MLKLNQMVSVPTAKGEPMAEYIEREELERILETRYERLAGLRPDFYAGFMMAAKIVEEETRNADVEPVVHGRWITDKNGVTVCSNCGEEHEWDEYRPTYCEDCGAKMDGVQNE